MAGRSLEIVEYWLEEMLESTGGRAECWFPGEHKSHKIDKVDRI